MLQCAEALDFTHRMNKILNTQRESDISTISDTSIDRRVWPSRRHPWTRTHSHYALMGGFVFDIGDIPSKERFLPGSRTRVTISPDGLLFLAKLWPSIIPDLDKAEIKDKDKAGGFDWFPFVAFLGQGLYLSWQNLPKSVVELISMGFAFFGLFTSLLWWKNQLNVTQPTLINDGSLHGLFAYLCFHNTFDDWNDSQHLINHNSIVAEPSAARSLPCFNYGKNKLNASQSSGAVIWQGVRRDKAPFYEHNKIEEDLCSQRIAAQYNIYKTQDQRRWVKTLTFWRQATLSASSPRKLLH